MADLVLVRLLEIPVSAQLVSPPTTALGPVGRSCSSLPKLSKRSHAPRVWPVSVGSPQAGVRVALLL